MSLPILFFVASGLLTFLALRWYRKPRFTTPLPGPPSTNYLTGHLRDMFGLHGIEFQEQVFKTYGPTVRMAAVMGDKLIFTLDPSFIHTALVKDRSKFDKSLGLILLSRSIFGGGLGGLRGDENRKQRKLLNPVFTEQHLRELVKHPLILPIFTDVAKQACQAIDKSLSTDVVDIIPWTTAAALELIGEAGLGYSFNSFSGERDKYSVATKSIAQLLVKILPIVPFYPYLASLPITRSMLSYVPIPLLRETLKAMRLQDEQAKQVLSTREDMLTRGADWEFVAGKGKDILTQLLKANEEGLDRDALIGHMNIFIFAGHETTSSAIARILDVLSQNSKIQDRLRNEVLESKDEDILELPYLDAVVKETLRLYPPLAFMNRICQEDTTVPLSYPISTASGTITSLPIEKGTSVLVSLLFSNRDERVWGERAREFWPDRWLEWEPPVNSGIQTVYSSMMTFGLGQYACIGFKFAVMEIKVMTAKLLHSFKFEPSEEEYVWEHDTIQYPYLTKERGQTKRVPKLPLKVFKNH